MKLPYRSPEFKSMAVTGDKVSITFEMFGSSLRAFDVAEATGFALCGADRVRYAWRTSRCSMCSRTTAFR
jgi:sialate O-acetylesterase